MSKGRDGAGQKLPTGIGGLDRELSGGIPPGSLVAIKAGPATQGEDLFQQVIGLRPTLYLSTLRESAAVEMHLSDVDEELFVKDIRKTKAMDNDAFKELTGTRGYSSPMEGKAETIDRAYELIDRIDRKMNVILDPANPLEATEDENAYQELINKFKSKVLQTDGLGIIHCITLGDVPPLRDMTLAISDVVLELQLVSGTNKKQYQLTMPKNRNGEPMLTETEVVFGTEVFIDETRNI